MNPGIPTALRSHFIRKFDATLKKIEKRQRTSKANQTDTIYQQSPRIFQTALRSHHNYRKISQLKKIWLAD